jgi:hypothetical protein
MPNKPLALVALFFLSSCGPYTDLGNGYEILDGGGSKQSLTKDRIVLINYTVTGFGRVDGHLIIESKGYGSQACEYSFADPNGEELIGLSPQRQAPIPFDRAVRAVEPLNARSCRAP